MNSKLMILSAACIFAAAGCENENEAKEPPPHHLMKMLHKRPGKPSPFLLDVHGAGAQRSDPKSGDASLFPAGLGPQGDEIRIRNYARCVRASSSASDSYTVIDTGVSSFYGNRDEISAPVSGEEFFGQDAHYSEPGFAYLDNGDGTVTDLNTGLMWQKDPDLADKSSYDDALSGAADFSLAGYSDWRLPSVKELYSLMNFSGSSIAGIPYLDTGIFGFRYGDEASGERLIDAQYWSSTEYTGLTFMHPRDSGARTVFGVNFADGRIKGYPADKMKGFVRYVRGNPEYGKNSFTDNGDNTVSDSATGLMWMKHDSSDPMDWSLALAYCEGLNAAGHTDWRLPDAKELHTIVDYSRSPEALDSSRQGAAIDPVFNLTLTESYFWTSSTLLETPADRGAGSHGIYFAFGRAMGYGPGPGGPPPGPGL